MLKETQGCLWNALDMFCGLDPKPCSKLAPEEAATEKMKERGAPSEGTEHRDTPAGTEHHDTPKGTGHRDKLESPFWRKVTNVSGFVLLLITVLCHIFYH